MGGCLSIINTIGEKILKSVGLGKPLAELTAIHIPSIDLERVEFVVDLLVTNPTPCPIPRIEIKYLVESDGRKLVSGLISDAGTIHGHGSETVSLPVTLIYCDIISTLGDIAPGSIIPYRIKVDLSVDVPVFGKLTLPLEETGEIPIPRIPEVELDNIYFQKFTFEETVADLHFKLENMNDFDLGLKSLDFEVSLSEHNIGSAKLNETTDITKKGISYIDVPISFRPKDLGSALWEMISGQGASYSLKGDIEVNTPFGAMKFPIIKLGASTSLKKNKEDGGDGDDEENPSLSAIAREPLQAAESLASGSLQAAGSLANESLEAAGSLASESLQNAGSLASESLQAAGSLANESLEAAGSLASESLQAAKSLASEPLQAAGSLANESLEAAGSLASESLQTAGSLAHESLQAAESLASEPLQAAGSLASESLQAAGSLASESLQTAGSLAHESLQAAESLASEPLQAAGSLASESLQAAGSLASESLQTAGSLASGSLQAAESVANGSLQAAGSLAHESLQTAKSLASEPLQAAGSLASESLHAAGSLLESAENVIPQELLNINPFNFG